MILNEKKCCFSSLRVFYWGLEKRDLGLGVRVGGACWVGNKKLAGDRTQDPIPPWRREVLYQPIK